jgi:hypothetical protein
VSNTFGLQAAAQRTPPRTFSQTVKINCGLVGDCGPRLAWKDCDMTLIKWTVHVLLMKSGNELKFFGNILTYGI